MKPGVLLLTALLAATAAARLLAQETSVTIYNDGRVLVRRAVPVSVARGASTVSVDLGVPQFEQGSLAVLDSGVELRGSRVIEATGQEGSLLRSLGREIEFMVGADSAPRYVRATLLSLTPPTLRVDGRIRYGFPGAPAFPDSVVQLSPRVELTLSAARAVNPLRLAYLSGGLVWQAAYTVVVPRSGPGPASVNGAAVIRNPGNLNMRNVQVQLLAGDVRRAPAQPMMAMRAPQALALEAAVVAPQEEAVGGVHVYSLGGAVDFVPGESRTVALFPRASAAVEPRYFLRAGGFGAMSAWSQPARDQHPDIEYRVSREARTGFGATPLPAGLVRVFAPDSAGRLQLLGETGIDHTPAGRDLKLVTGTAFDLTAERVQTEFDRRTQREVVSAYRVTLHNAKSERVIVQVEDQFSTEWDLLSSSIPGERPTATSVRFPVPVAAGGDATLEYRIRLHW
jgi:hypothetical protein